MNFFDLVMGRDKNYVEKAQVMQLLEEQERLSAQKLAAASRQLELLKIKNQRLEQEKEELARKLESLKNTRQTVPSDTVTKRYDKSTTMKENNKTKKQLQKDLAECSKIIHDIQHAVKEAYQFEPCRQLCELLVNLRQKVYLDLEDVKEDLAYVIEAFEINEFEPAVGETFQAKYHDQSHSRTGDARGRRINRIYASGFEKDGEVIVKAQVSVEE